MPDRLDALRHDLVYTLRSLLRAPAYAATVAASFGLGIGANATMFGIVDRLLLSPPAHVSASHDLVKIQRNFRFRAEERSGTILSYPVYRALRESVAGFAAVAMYTPAKSVSLGVGAEARPAQYVLVSGDYFGTLGTRMARGRPLLPEDDLLPQGSRVVVIGYGLWQRQFGGQPNAVGSTITLASEDYTIVGVAPREFVGIDRRPVDVWIPVSAAAGLRHAGSDWATNPGVTWLEVVARLAPGASPQAAAAEAGAVLRSPELASTGTQDTTTSVTLRSVLPSRQPLFTAEKRVAMLLAAVSVFVLLIACTNVANLLLVRALRRRREIAVRLALGIGRARLVRQLVIESLAMALIGGVAALGVVRWGSDLVQKLLLSDYAWPESPLDLRVLAYTAVATLGVGLLAGLVPALQASTPELSRSLKEGSRSAGTSHSRTQVALLLVQTALSVVLLVATGLFVRSLANVSSVDLGLDVDRLVMGRIDLRSVGLDSAASEEYFRDAAARVRRIPGVASAVVAEAPPLGGWSMGTVLRVPGRDSLPHLDPDTYKHSVPAGYFATVGTRILRGREFVESDSYTGAEPVVILNEGAARALWPNEAALGRCVQTRETRPSCARIVGIAEDTHRGGITAEEKMLQVYQPFGRPELGPRAYVLLVRSREAAPERLVEPVRRSMQTITGNLPFAEVRTMRATLAGELKPWRLGATMFGAFGAIAIVLSALGLYGVVAYSVAQRTHEMGVRAALGARPIDIMRLVMLQGLRVTVAGVAVGVVVAMAAGRLVRPLLYEVSPRDPMVFGMVIGMLLTVAALASLVPARRATRTDPLDALRAE